MFKELNEGTIYRGVSRVKGINKYHDLPRDWQHGEAVWACREGLREGVIQRELGDLEEGLLNGNCHLPVQSLPAVQ